MLLNCYESVKLMSTEVCKICKLILLYCLTFLCMYVCVYMHSYVYVYAFMYSLMDAES
jgi:hypothetical protein